MESGTPNGDVYDIYKSSSSTWTINTYANIINRAYEMTDISSHDFTNTSYIYYKFSGCGATHYLTITPSSITTNGLAGTYAKT